MLAESMDQDARRNGEPGDLARTLVVVGSNPTGPIIIYLYECVQLQEEDRVLVKEDDESNYKNSKLIHRFANALRLSSVGV